MPPRDPSSSSHVLLLAEIGGAAALRERLGSSVYERMRNRYVELFEHLCAVFPGATVTPDGGDGCRALFGTVEDAAWFASQFEQAVRDQPWATGVVRPRIAIHLGESPHDGKRAEADPAPPGANLLTIPVAGEQPDLDTLRRLRADLYRADEPTEIGPYRILQPLGEGGMGIVYKVEQRYPVKRVVALKLIKLGMDTKDVIARFESERQALALMNHPNVAKVFDAGATGTGRPYFVMEYVPGDPITTYCDRHNLTTQKRLELFTQACAAVQHAHQKAIIHRDLKPSNILVSLEDGKPLVKVIDFGVAKAVSQRLTERTLFTETGQLVGTPEYMSPEQAEMTALDVDTRTDIYSLGVVLYELLCGALPFDPRSLRSAGFNEIQRIIRETDPPRPSTRVSGLADTAAEVARHRRTHPAALERELRHELEWIPLKAIHKERNRRYATATELAQDIQNYLARRPLLAGPESAAYRLRKFARRNKGPLAAAGGLLVMLLVLVVSSLVYVHAVRGEQRRTAAQKARAETEAAKQAAVNRFLQEMLASADPYRLRRDVTVRQVLDDAVRKLNAGDLKDQPLIDAALRGAIGNTYRALGEHAQAEPLLRTMLDTYAAAPAANPLDVAAAASDLGFLLQSQGKLSEAEPLYREALTLRRRLLGDSATEVATSLNNLGLLLYAQGKLDEAEPLLRGALEQRRKRLGNTHHELAVSLNSLAVLLQAKGNLSEAEPLCREAVTMGRRLHGAAHPDQASSLSNLGLILHHQGKRAEAEPLYREALAMDRELLGIDHPALTVRLLNLSALLTQERKLAEAEPLIRDALAIQRKQAGGGDPSLLGHCLVNLGDLLRDKGELADAEPLLREALSIRRTHLGPQHPDVGLSLNNLAALQRDQGNAREAEANYREAIEVFGRALGKDHPNTIMTTASLGDLCLEGRRPDAALPLLEDAFERSKSAQMEPAWAARAALTYGKCLVALNRYRDAEAPLRTALDRLRASGAGHDGRHRRTLAMLTDVCEQTGRPEEAARWRAELAGWEAATRPASGPTAAPVTASTNAISR